MGEEKGPPDLRIGVILKCRIYREALVAVLTRWNLEIQDLGPGDEESRASLLKTQPEIVLLGLPVSEATALVRHARQNGSCTHFIACDVAVDETVALQLFESGIESYALPVDSLDDLYTTVMRTHHGELSCNARIAAAMARRLGRVGFAAHAVTVDLSPRQRQILRFLKEGLTNKEIAVRLNVSPCTVKNHVHATLRKLGLHRRQDASDTARCRLPS